MSQENLIAECCGDNEKMTVANPTFSTNPELFSRLKIRNHSDTLKTLQGKHSNKDYGLRQNGDLVMVLTTDAAKDPERFIDPEQEEAEAAKAEEVRAAQVRQEEFAASQKAKAAEEAVESIEPQE